MTSEQTNESYTPNEVQPLEDWQYYDEDFAFDPDMFCRDDERISRLKEIISTKLSVGERNIFLLYAHNNSNCHKTAKLLGCSVTTARNRIIQIRNKILYYYDKADN